VSVEAFTWALRVPIGGNAKVVLLGLANHAHPDGSEAYPALDTLAEYAHCDRSTARRNVRKLEESGWIIRDGDGPKGTTKYRLAMGAAAPGSKTPPVAQAPDGGGTGAAEGVALAPPEPSLEPSNEPGTRSRAKHDPTSLIPGDFPDELRAHARLVLPVLRSVAEQHGAREVTPLALARLMMAPDRRRKPFVRAAHDFASWAADPPRPIRDAVSSYRTWVDRERNLQGIEPVPGDGGPGSGSSNGGGRYTRED
jgi:hypothetical protein